MTKLPNGWEVKKLGDICKLQNGFAFKSSLFSKNGVPIVRIKNIQNEKVVLEDLVYCNPNDYENDLTNYTICKNDILIAMSGATTGKIGLYDLEEKAYLNQRVGLLRISDEVTRKYIFWFLYFNSGKNLNIALGAAQPNLSTTQIHNIQIPLPSLEEQRKIVKILDEKFASIDESIRLAKDNLLSLDELWQSILNDSFNPLKSKPDNDTYTLPPTWKWEKLGDICEKTKNANLKDFNDDISYIDISSIDNKNFMILDCKKINSTQAPSRAKRQVKFGDILYATTRPNLKNIAMVNQEYYNPIASTGFCIIRAKKDVKKYIFYFLLSDYVTDFVARFIKGAQYPAVSDKDIFNIQIPLPPLEEQERIAKELESKAKTIKELKELYAKRLKDYEELKESLLDLAFKGGL